MHCVYVALQLIHLMEGRSTLLAFVVSHFQVNFLQVFCQVTLFGKGRATLLTYIVLDLFVLCFHVILQMTFE